MKYPYEKKEVGKRTIVRGIYRAVEDNQDYNFPRTEVVIVDANKFMAPNGQIFYVD